MDDLFGQIPRKKKRQPNVDPPPTPPPPSNPTAESPIARVPRKKKKRTIEAVSIPDSAPRKRRPVETHAVTLVSETPFTLRITGINLPRRQQRAVVQRRHYTELEDTDSDDLMTPEEEAALMKRQAKKKPAAATTATTTTHVQRDVVAIDAPPPGTLPSLYYSNERFLNIWSMDKICGWKTRPKVQLKMKSVPPDGDSVTADSTAPTPVKLDVTEASKMQIKLLTDDKIWSDPKHRMEISRLVPRNCPTVIAATASQPTSPYELVPTTEREEVLLIKWRGRSHMHCSWERSVDIQHLDPSPNNTARGRIKRFYEKMVHEKGIEWKKVIEEEQLPAHRHPVEGETQSGHGNNQVHGDVLDEYFSPQCLEVERIMGCDENEMDLHLFAKQRGINLRCEQIQTELLETEQGKKDEDLNSLIKQVASQPDSVWDPEDNVRYIVKWKGVGYADVTWEYWRDIKRDAVDEAEDFWYRQQPPDIENVNRPHPKISEFKKLQESPAYGVSKRPRPVAKLEGYEQGAGSEDTDAVMEQDNGFRLRNYQLEGVNWLLFNWWNNRSCLLSDEMGLGKTIQSAAFLQELQCQEATQIRGPFLIIAPLSLAAQWQSELKSWAPDMNVILFHGSADAREFLVQQEFYFSEQFVSKPVASKLKKLHVTKFHVLITTYEMVQKDVDVFRKIKWQSLIIDEAHRLKNYKSKLFETLAMVDRQHCLLLTGTPIANATEELWALLHFANPGDFRDRDAFLERFGEMTDAKQVNELHAQIRKYLLRREKKDVEKSLPNKEETILEISLTPIQKTFYKAIYERNTSFLFKGAKANNAPSLMNVMMELRKCCNHPFLVTGAEEKILNDAAAKLQQSHVPDEQNPAPVINSAKLFEEQLVKSSGKMVLLDKLLQKLFDGGHKVLIFSQMVRLLDLLEEFLKIKKYRFERLDGTTSSSARLHAVERFKNPACQRFVMLLSTRAGGLGLNLTAADIVIIFDSDWNPQNDLQAMARAHRIGQTRAVKVYRLLTAKTYEMHMFHSASLKLGLERALMSRNTEEDGDGSKVSKRREQEAKAKQIDELLKKGAYDVFRDEDDTEAEKFMETDIDQLLEQSSKTVTYGSGATSSIGSGLGSFNKASFVANTESGEKDVDLDDPDFWAKAVGLETPPEDVPDLPMIDDGVKRHRKQVQQYDPYAETAIAEQAKKDKVAMEKMLAQEEKERLKEEKKQKKLKAQEDKQRKKDEQDKIKRQKLAEKAVKFKQGLQASDSRKFKIPKLGASVPKPKKMKKSDRAKELRRAANEDPLLEKLKQAWEIPQRNRATGAVVRFGFGRFCKLRIESNLSSLPLQDIEVFARVYVFQVALQVAVSMLERIREEKSITDFQELMIRWVGMGSGEEVDWLCDSVKAALEHYKDVEEGRISLRIPWILTEPTYVEDLKHGAGFRSLRRVGILSRLNKVIEDVIDSIIHSLGTEELGKRGCGPNELANLDVDLKSRFVTNEELVLAVGLLFKTLSHKPPASWWDQKCDGSLIVGTFVHGLSNYELMRKDQTLPFSEKIGGSAEHDPISAKASSDFLLMATATREVFDEASEARRVKEEQEVQAKIAEAKKFASEREEAAALVRKGGVEAEVVAKNMPETEVTDAFEFDGTDSHFVTLPRLHKRIQTSISDCSGKVVSTPASLNASPDSVKSRALTAFGNDQSDRRISSKRQQRLSVLPMPDARVLDHRLILLLQEIEACGRSTNESDLRHLWDVSEIVGVNTRMRTEALSFLEDSCDLVPEYAGVGIGSNQCGISHRGLNDGSDYGAFITKIQHPRANSSFPAFGSATADLYQLAYGTDAPRYLRALCVPMNITRFAISGLVYVDEACVDRLMKVEHFRFYGRSDESSSSEAVHLSTKRLSGFGSHENKLDASSSDQRTVLSSNDLIGNGSTEKEDAIQSLDPSVLIDESFRTNTELRAGICLAALLFGVPNAGKRTLDESIIGMVDHVNGDENDNVLFDYDMFRTAVVSLAKGVSVVPDTKKIMNYIENSLMPHCLKLCIEGNGPSTRNARGSHGDYETAFGISIHPEPSQPHPSPLPDPILAAQEHSLEALGYANAILRRISLLNSIVHICSSPTQKDRIVTAINSMNRHSLDDLPVWWQPHIHDVALLVEAGCSGLFSILKKRQEHPVFSQPAIRQQLFRHMVDNSKLRHVPKDSIMAMAEVESAKFPTLFQLERRLASFCALATEDLDPTVKFHLVPMFDHGGWPRN